MSVSRVMFACIYDIYVLTSHSYVWLCMLFKVVEGVSILIYDFCNFETWSARMQRLCSLVSQEAARGKLPEASCEKNKTIRDNFFLHILCILKQTIMLLYINMSTYVMFYLSSSSLGSQVVSFCGVRWQSFWAVLAAGPWTTRSISFQPIWCSFEGIMKYRAYLYSTEPFQIDTDTLMTHD